MTSQPRDSTKHDTAKFGIDLYWDRRFIKGGGGGGGVHPDFLGNFDFEIAVDQQSKAHY